MRTHKHKPTKFKTTLHLDIEFEASDDANAQQLAREILARIREEFDVLSYINTNAVPVPPYSISAVM